MATVKSMGGKITAWANTTCEPCHMMNMWGDDWLPTAHCELCGGETKLEICVTWEPHPQSGILWPPLKK